MSVKTLDQLLRLKFLDQFLLIDPPIMQ